MKGPTADPDPRRLDFDRRLSIALGASVRAGLAWSKVAPPGARWLWRRGIRLPPFHLMPFWWSTLVLGVAWGTPMCVFFAVQNLLMYGSVNPGLLILVCGVGGLGFGLTMAIFGKLLLRGGGSSAMAGRPGRRPGRGSRPLHPVRLRLHRRDRAAVRGVRMDAGRLSRRRRPGAGRPTAFSAEGPPVDRSTLRPRSAAC